jgi:hypothetical protein
MDAIRVYEPPAGSADAVPVNVDTLADGSVREVVRVVKGAASVSYNEALSCVPGSSTVVTHILTTAGLLIHGFDFTGTGNGKAYLVDSGANVTLGFDIISTVHKKGGCRLPVPYAPATGADVQVVVTCLAAASCDYEAAIYGEVTPS